MEEVEEVVVMEEEVELVMEEVAGQGITL